MESFNYYTYPEDKYTKVSKSDIVSSVVLNLDKYSSADVYLIFNNKKYRLNIKKFFKSMTRFLQEIEDD